MEREGPCCLFAGELERGAKADIHSLAEGRGLRFAKVAELADALDLGSSPARGRGSTPLFRTISSRLVLLTRKYSGNISIVSKLRMVH